MSDVGYRRVALLLAILSVLVVVVVAARIAEWVT